MKAAAHPVQRPATARVLVLAADGVITHLPRARFVDLLRPGDLVIANDAATLPASLHGIHERTNAEIEVRLARRATLEPDDIHNVSAVVFGAGDFRTRTEDRPAPPALKLGDRLRLGPLMATVTAGLGHPRFITMRFDGTPFAVWEGLACHGRPIQYAHVTAPLALWDVWSPIAAAPVAFEPPSAGFVLDWSSIAQIRARGIAFRTVTLAAGLSSTGDPELDGRLPLDEPYRIPEATAAAIKRARSAGHRVVAIGTTVVRALEHAAATTGVVRAGDGTADQRVDGSNPLRIVDAILSGTHEQDSSHYQLLRAFVDDATLRQASATLEAHGYLTHEFGDSMFVEATPAGGRRICTAADWSPTWSAAESAA